MSKFILTALVGATLFTNPNVDKSEDPLPIKYDIFEYVENQREFTMRMLEEKDATLLLERAVKEAEAKAKAKEKEEKALRERLAKQKEEKKQQVQKMDKKYRAFINATFVLETGGGTSYMWEHMNNPGGIKCNGPGQTCSRDNYRYFSTKEEGMAEKERLLQGYFNKYGDDFKTIREIYCQCGPDDYPKFMEIYNQEYAKL